jgi:immune inhibitor A
MKTRLYRTIIVLVAFCAVLAASALSISTVSANTAPNTPQILPGQSRPQNPLRVMVPNPRIGKVNLSGQPAQNGPQLSGGAVPAVPPSSPSLSPSLIAGNNGVFKTLAILVQFSDNLHTASVDPTTYDSLLFGTTGKTVRNFYRENSYNQFDLVTVNLPSALGWQNAPQLYTYYTNNGFCYGFTYPNNCQKLTEDLVALVDPVVDFSQYDNNNDGFVDTVFIIHAGIGAEVTSNPQQIWSHSWQTFTVPNVDGKYVSSYTVEPEYSFVPGDSTRGVFAHELGHVFGLPDLYDIDYSSAGVGNWSLMSHGAWNGSPQGSDPANLDAWSRIFLGYTTSSDITNFKGVISFPAVEQFSTGAIFRINTGQPNEYYLLENRQPTGSDAFLPGNGLLIWHVDGQAAMNGTSNQIECLSNALWNCPATSHFRATRAMLAIRIPARC